MTKIVNRMTTRRLRGVAAVLLGAVALVSGPVSAQTPTNTLIRIGTSEAGGASYQTGTALCALVNKAEQSGGNLTCMVAPEEGSLAILKGLRSGFLTLGIVQSDAMLGDIKRGNSSLRSVMGLFPEYLQVVVRGDSGIADLQGLHGRTFAAGAPGSASRITMGGVLEAAGGAWSDFGLLHDLPREKFAQALCDGSLDGFSVVTGLGASLVTAAAQRCGGRLIPVSGLAAGATGDSGKQDLGKQDLGKQDFAFTIPAGTYPGQEAPIATIRLLAVLASGATVPDSVIYECVKAIFMGMDALLATEPTLGQLSPAQRVSLGAIAPVHPGVSRYLKETGQLP